MSIYASEVLRARGEHVFTDNYYSRVHHWRLDVGRYLCQNWGRL